VILQDHTGNIRQAFYHFLPGLKGDFLHQGEFNPPLGTKKITLLVDNKNSGCRLGKKTCKKFADAFSAMGADKFTRPHGHPSRSPFLFLIQISFSSFERLNPRRLWAQMFPFDRLDASFSLVY